ILGRDSEIRQVIDILTRRRQNNPILTGEAGVGKTAVVEGFAIRIAEGDVPPALRDVTVRTLDLGLLQAGAGVRGEFENRLKSVIEEVKSSPRPIILFIDEAHTMIGAGGQAGQSDAANLLKPALARGELRTIAATTWAEYKKYFEKDAALSRRFQVVKVEEPPEASAIAMVRGLVGTLEKHHGVRILDEAVSEAVRLSARYIPSRQLPDKAVSLIDTACARVAMSQSASPAAIEDRQRRISLVDTELRIVEREIATGADHTSRKDELLGERAKAKEELHLKEAMERRVVGQAHALDAVAQAIRTSRAKLTDPRKPIGVFLLVGQSGTGKTETALTLADLLYGGEQNLTVINMSEFKEEHKVSLLMGSPPGYVGYGEGGILTDAVRRRPYSVILLDEME